MLQEFDTAQDDANISSVDIFLLLSRIISVLQRQDQLVSLAGIDLPNDGAVGFCRCCDVTCVSVVYVEKQVVLLGQLARSEMRSSGLIQWGSD